MIWTTLGRDADKIFRVFGDESDGFGVLLAPEKHPYVRYVIRRGELFAAEDRHGADEIFWVGFREAFMLRFQTKAEAERFAKPGDDVLAFVEFV
jgi:hypothetical protein